MCIIRLKIIEMDNERRRVAIVTDGASSMRPEYQEVKDLEVTLIPLSLSFREDNKDKPYREFDFTLKEFYDKMRNSPQLPLTSGIVMGDAVTPFKELSERYKVLAVHVSSKLSGTYNSSREASEIVKTAKPKAEIEVMDTKQLSYGVWIPAREAAQMALQGKDANEIKNMIFETCPKINVIGALKYITNGIAGGRFKSLNRWVNALVPIHPTFRVEDGKVMMGDKFSTFNKAKENIFETVKKVISESAVREIAIVHTNAPDMAGELRDRIKALFKKDIQTLDAGVALAVHASEDAFAVIYRFA